MFIRFTLALILSLLTGGCANLAYYAQAVEGQMEIVASARPISQVVDDPHTSPQLRQQLQQATRVRDFASHELGLPENGSYRNYVDLGRPYVVWNVFAAKEFSTELEEWCLLFVGCVNYRGYYSREAAEHFARQQQALGLETYVANIPAYSTLGFFDDPVLNTFVGFGEQEVARLVFHELAHQVAFVAGDTVFNESFATAVEEEGMRRWLERTLPPSQHVDFGTQKSRKAQFEQLVADFRDKLTALYASPEPMDDKRRAKEKIFAELKQAHADLKTAWGDATAYDGFFSRELNNAKLGSVGLYTRLVPAFQALLQQEGNNLPRFYQKVKALARLDKGERRSALDRLQNSGSRLGLAAGHQSSSPPPLEDPPSVSQESPPAPASKSP